MNKIHYFAAFFIFICTCLFCNWPDFHPEDHVGMNYHWALDMCFHGGYFFAATLTLLWLLNRYASIVKICLLLWLLSFLLEIVQIWVPGRSFTLLDLLSNTLGISLGGLVFLWWRNNVVNGL